MVSAGTSAASRRRSRVRTWPVRRCRPLAAAWCRACRLPRRPAPSASPAAGTRFATASARDSAGAALDLFVRRLSARSSARLAVTWRAMASALSSGTPFFSKVPSVRAIRAVSTFSSSGPITLHAQQPRVPGQPRSRIAQTRPPAYSAATDQQQQQPPPVCRNVAERQHDLGDQRDRHLHVVEDRHELRHHVGQQQHQRAEHADHQERRIDQRIDDAAAQAARAFQIIGQAAQRFLQRTAGFAGAHQADVQLGEHAVFLVQRATTAMLPPRTRSRTRSISFLRAFAFGQFQQDAQRAIQRLAGAEQGRRADG